MYIVIEINILKNHIYSDGPCLEHVRAFFVHTILPGTKLSLLLNYVSNLCISGVTNVKITIN